MKAAGIKNKDSNFVLSKTPHGTALDAECVVQDLWSENPRTEKLLFFSDIKRTGKCMVSVQN